MLLLTKVVIIKIIIKILMMIMIIMTTTTTISTKTLNNHSENSICLFICLDKVLSCYVSKVFKLRKCLIFILVQEIKFVKKISQI